MKKQRISKSTFIIAGCFLLLFTLNLSQVAAEEKRPFKLGVNLDITGQAGWTAEPATKAIQLYVEQVNAKGGIGGRPIELVIYDNETNPEKASVNAKKLILRDKVSAIIGPSLTSTTNAVKQIAQEEKVVMYSHSGSFKPNYPNSFTFATWPETPDMIETIYDYFLKKGIKRVAGLYGTDSTGQTWFEESKEAAKRHGLEFAGDHFNIKDVDVTVQLTKLKALNPQALIVGVTGKPVAVVAQNFIQMGFKIPFVTGSGNMSDDFLELMKYSKPDTLLLSGVKYVVWRDLPDSFPQKKIMTEFNEAFQKKFNKAADIYGVLGYDSARVIVEALNQVGPQGTNDSVILRDAIEKVKNFPAVMGGTYNFSKKDHRGIGKNAAVMIQVKDGKFRMAD